MGGGRVTADVLQELYLKARIREAEEQKRQEEDERKVEVVRQRLAMLPVEHVEAAISQGVDGLQDAFDGALGEGAWERAVTSVPDEWDEEEALAAFGELLRRPKQSEHARLLLACD